MSKHERPEIKDYKEDTDISRVHSAVLREKLNLSTRRENAPTWVLVLCAFVLIGGGTYLGAYSAGFRDDVSDPFKAVHVVDNRIVGGPVELAESNLGKENYAICASCHQLNGTGNPGAIPPVPPLDGSEWVTGNPKRIAAIISKGLSGPIEVSGTAYNGVMPMQNLNDEALAAVISYIRTSWGNESEPVTAEWAAEVREELKDVQGPIDVEFLKSTFPED